MTKLDSVTLFEIDESGIRHQIAKKTVHGHWTGPLQSAVRSGVKFVVDEAWYETYCGIGAPDAVIVAIGVPMGPLLDGFCDTCDEKRRYREWVKREAGA